MSVQVHLVKMPHPAKNPPVAMEYQFTHINAPALQAMQTACAYTIISASTQQSAA
jgi:hypothetical protein